MNSFGIDIGGTTIKAGLVNENGVILFKRVIPTEKNLMEQLFGLIDEALKEGTFDSIGIGSAGKIDPKTGRVKYATSNLSEWTGVSIKEKIEERVGIKTRVINDADAAAFGEWIGFHNEKPSLVLLTVGTGLGSGFIINNRLIQGKRGGAGDAGHIVIDDDGPLCNCGKKGCAEQFVSMRVLHKLVAKEKGKELDRFELISGFKSGDDEIIKSVKTVSHYLARVIDTVFFLVDPDIVVIGGGISELGDDFLSLLREEVKKCAINSLYSPEDICLAEAGNDAGIVGAAMFAIKDFNEII